MIGILALSLRFAATLEKITHIFTVLACLDKFWHTVKPRYCEGTGEKIVFYSSPSDWESSSIYRGIRCIRVLLYNLFKKTKNAFNGWKIDIILNPVEVVLWEERTLNGHQRSEWEYSFGWVSVSPPVGDWEQIRHEKFRWGVQGHF